MEQNETAPRQVGIVSLWYGLNYGSILTAWALYDAVEALGFAPTLLHKPASLWSPRYNAPDSPAGRFTHAHCRVAESVPTDSDWQQSANGYDTLLVGSDALWREDVCGKDVDDLFYLPFTPDTTRRVAYATTADRILRCSGDRLPAMRAALSRFAGISVKEKETQILFSGTLHTATDQVLDPMFLPSPAHYQALISASAAAKTGLPERFVFSYIEGPDPRKTMLVNRCVDIYEAPLRNLGDLNALTPSEELPPAPCDAPDDWLCYLKNCAFVVTDSYYAMCLALAFEKPFVVLAHEDFPDLYRFRAVLDALGLEERLVILEEDLRLKEYLFRKPVRYSLVTPALQAQRDASLAWLRDALTGAQEAGK